MAISSFGNFPLSGEAGNRFYRRRLSFIATIVGVNLFVFHAFAALLFTRPPAVGGASSDAVPLLLAAFFLALGEFLRRSQLSLRIVRATELPMILIACTTTLGQLFALRFQDRPDLLAILAATHILTNRAALVPSTAWRTLLVGSVALAPFAPATYLAYRNQTPEAFASSIMLLLWCISALIATTLCSWLIFRLARSAEASRKLGQYTLEEKIGEGGMGEVYRASHALLRRPTAVKLLPSSRGDERDIARFEREVQLTSQLANPNTIQIYDFGRAEDGTFYYAMELLDGLTLEELVRSYGPQPAWRVGRILADVCDSLAEAHAADMVHRDIKPQNIMVCARGGVLDQVKVLDFGLVRSVSRFSATTSATDVQVAGTPAYMAPEAYVAPADIDARADLYAVGAVGYYLLTGAPPYEGDSAFVIFGKLMHSEPIPISERANARTPEALERLVHACLAKSPADRPQTSRALAKSLSEIAGQEPPLDLEAWWRAHDLRAAGARRSPQGGRSRVFNATR